VDAESLRVDGDVGAVGGGDSAAFDDAEGLAGGFGRIAEERVVELTRAQGAVGFVAAVGEGFCGGGEAGFAEDFEHQ